MAYCLGNYEDKLGATGWQWLVRNFLTMSVESRKELDFDISRKPKTVKTEYISEEELASYRYIHPYMYKRKMTDEIIEMFDVGYDKNTQCITFPVRDITGNTLFIARRSVNYKYFNYPENATKPLYGLYELYQLREFPQKVIVVESIIDALTCWAYGKPAVALNGLGTDLQFKQLRMLPCRHIILATDNDQMGLKARVNIRKHVTGKLISEYVFPANVKDINDMDFDTFNKLEERF